MSATSFSRSLATHLVPRKVIPGIPTSVIRRRFADRTPHRPDQSNESHPLNLKKLGATRTVRIVVYGALGVAAIAETAFWCSWLWSKAFKRAADEPEQQT